MAITTRVDGDGYSKEVTIDAQRGPVKQGKIVADPENIKRLQKELGVKESGTMNKDTTLALQARLAQYAEGGKYNAQARDGLAQSTNPQDRALGDAIARINQDVFRQSYKPFSADELRISMKDLQQPQSAVPVVPKAPEAVDAALKDYRDGIQQQAQKREQDQQTAKGPATQNEDMKAILSDLSDADRAKLSSPESLAQSSRLFRDEFEAQMKEVQRQLNVPQTGKFDIETNEAMVASKDPEVKARLKGLEEGMKEGVIKPDGSVDEARVQDKIREGLAKKDGPASDAPNADAGKGGSTYVHPVAAFERDADGNWHEAESYNGGKRVPGLGYEAPDQGGMPRVDMDSAETARRFRELMDKGVVGSVKGGPGDANPQEQRQTVAAAPVIPKMEA